LSLRYDKKYLKDKNKELLDNTFYNIYDCGTHLNRIFQKQKLIFFEHGLFSIFSYLEDFLRFKNIYQGNLYDFFLQRNKSNLFVSIKNIFQKKIDYIFYLIFYLTGISFPIYTKKIMTLNSEILNNYLNKNKIYKFNFLKTEIHILNMFNYRHCIKKKIKNYSKKQNYIIIAEFTDYILNFKNVEKISNYLIKNISKKDKVIFKSHPIHLKTKKNFTFNNLLINKLKSLGIDVIQDDNINMLPIEFIVKYFKIDRIISDITSSSFSSIEYVNKKNICINFSDINYPIQYQRKLLILNHLFKSKVLFKSI
jgi:hypothetical protein